MDLKPFQVSVTAQLQPPEPDEGQDGGEDTNAVLLISSDQPRSRVFEKGVVITGLEGSLLGVGLGDDGDFIISTLI